MYELNGIVYAGNPTPMKKVIYAEYRGNPPPRWPA